MFLDNEVIITSRKPLSGRRTYISSMAPVILLFETSDKQRREINRKEDCSANQLRLSRYLHPLKSPRPFKPEFINMNSVNDAQQREPIKIPASFMDE